MTPKSEHRKTRRFPVQIAVSLTTIDTFLDSEIMNLSKGGIFIKADLPLPLGTEVDLVFTLPNSAKSIQATGTVVWTRRRGESSQASSFPDHPSGMGIQFKEIGMDQIEAILDEIEELMQLSN